MGKLVCVFFSRMVRISDTSCGSPGLAGSHVVLNTEKGCATSSDHVLVSFLAYLVTARGRVFARNPCKLDVHTKIGKNNNEFLQDVVLAG